MDMTSHPVIEGLRLTLVKSRGAFIDEMESRIRQLIGNMVDGQMLPKDQIEGLRAAVIDLVRSEAIPKLGNKHPNDALRILDKLKAYGFIQLESERTGLEAISASRFPPPLAVAWEEVDVLRQIAKDDPASCTIEAPVGNVYFATQLQDEGIQLPDELLGLYAACDGFDLSSRGTHVPVFSLLPSVSIDPMDERGGYPRRAAIFQGGDEVQFSVYRDRKKQWWLVYEYEYESIAKRHLDLRTVIRFGLSRMNDSELSWDVYFEVSE